jgi:hypothetical protein
MITVCTPKPSNCLATQSLAVEASSRIRAGGDSRARAEPVSACADAAVGDRIVVSKDAKLTLTFLQIESYWIHCCLLVCACLATMSTF